MPIPTKDTQNLRLAAELRVKEQVLFSNTNTSKAAKAMNAPPAPLTNVPHAVMPPYCDEVR